MWMLGNPLRAIQLGIFLAGLCTIAILWWRLGVISESNEQLSSTILEQEQTIDDLMALDLRKEAASKVDTENALRNNKNKSRAISDIGRLNDEKNAMLRGGFNDVVERLWSDTETD